VSIHLNEEDRADLERLEKGRMKPTRRQKAIALLRLAAGLPPADAAKHAGIPKEEVEALAIGFAEGGLSGVGLGGKPQNLVRLVRLGVGVQKYYLPKGATLSDLLHQTEATTINQTLFVDGVMAEATMRLRDGALVIVVPHQSNAEVDEPWRATIPSFRDETLFRQYTETLKARRRDLGPEEDPEA
jgi:hypothetical protein